MDVALGFRPHSGWAVAVVVGHGPAVLERHRVALADRPPPVQPYHAAVGLPAHQAAGLVAEATRSAYTMAAAAVGALVAAHRVIGVAIVAGAGSAREDLTLEQVLGAHARLHAAEGELYRDALADAADALGLPVTLVGPRETPALGQRLLGCDGAELRVRLAELGRPFGPPWTKDHKDAVLAALCTLEP